MHTEKKTLLVTLPAAMLLYGGISTNTHGLEYVLRPSVSATQSYNDNYRLAGSNELSTWSTRVSPALDLSVKAPNWLINGNGRVESRWVHKESDLDTNDSFLSLGGMRAWQRSRINLDLAYNQTTTLRDDFSNEDAGLTILQVDRDTGNANLNWSTSLTPSLFWSLGYQFLDVDYDQDDAGGNSLVDYTYEVPSTSLTYQYSPKTQLITRLNYAQYQPDTPLDQDSETTSLTFGAEHQLNESLSMSFSVGARNTKSTAFAFILVPIPGTPFATRQLVSQDSDETGTIFSGSLTKTTLTGEASLSLSQSTMPTSSGTESENTSLSANWKHRLSETFSLQFQGLASRYNTIGGNESSNDRKLYKLEPRVVWHGARNWTLTGSYVYTQVDREALDREDTSNMIFATFRYQWTRQSLSR